VVFLWLVKAKIVGPLKEGTSVFPALKTTSFTIIVLSDGFFFKMKLFFTKQFSIFWIKIYINFFLNR